MEKASILWENASLLNQELVGRRKRWSYAATVEGEFMVSDSVSVADEASSVTLRRRRPRAKLWLLMLAIMAVILVSWSLTPEAVWDGYFSLALDVRSESGRAIKELSYATFFKNEQAQWLLTEHAEGEPDSDFRSAVQNNGRFSAEVSCSGRFSIFNIETRYTEPRYLVLRVTYADGKESRRLAEIPAGRGPPSMTVVVP